MIAGPKEQGAVEYIDHCIACMTAALAGAMISDCKRVETIATIRLFRTHRAVLVDGCTLEVFKKAATTVVNEVMSTKGRA
jgi:hypothetical protein